MQVHCHKVDIVIANLLKTIAGAEKDQAIKAFQATAGKLVEGASKLEQGPSDGGQAVGKPWFVRTMDYAKEAYVGFKEAIRF